MIIQRHCGTGSCAQKQISRPTGYSYANAIPCAFFFATTAW